MKLMPRAILFYLVAMLPIAPLTAISPPQLVKPVKNYVIAIPLMTWIIGEGIVWLGGSIAAVATTIIVKEAIKSAAKNNGINVVASEAQAPGKPTASEGFKPPKKWDGQKVRNPNGHGYGWPDDKGSVWVPTGPGGHGGPHWDVEKPDGTYDNVYPGGKIR